MTGSIDPKAHVVAIDLDETGWLTDPESASPITAPALLSYFADQLMPPAQATDIFVYVHGWQTSSESAVKSASELQSLALHRFEVARQNYPDLAARGFQPWTVVIRWPSASSTGRRGYELIRDRAHAMGAQGGTGLAAHVIGSLLGYLDAGRPDPTAAEVLANRDGQYLHLIGHSFGCRFLCEAVMWAAEASLGYTLGWSLPSAHPFTVDSMLLFQMAAPTDAFSTLFGELVPREGHSGAPIRGPVVATYTRYDRATGFWHKRAEGQAGIGHSGIGQAPGAVFNTHMLPVGERYELDTLDHRFVNVEASKYFVRGRRLSPAGAHSAHIRPESAHLLLSLADHSR